VWQGATNRQGGCACTGGSASLNAWQSPGHVHRPEKVCTGSPCPTKPTKSVFGAPPHPEGLTWRGQPAQEGPQAPLNVQTWPAAIHAYGMRAKIGPSGLRSGQSPHFVGGGWWVDYAHAVNILAPKFWVRLAAVAWGLLSSAFGGRKEGILSILIPQCEINAAPKCHAMSWRRQKWREV